MWKDKLAKKHGRSGQAQSGIDVYGSPADLKGEVHGVQCKGKAARYGAKATTTEVLKELALAETFVPNLGHWTFATTAPDDADLQAFVRTLSAERIAEGKFPIDIIGWGTILGLMAEHPSVIETHYPEHGRQLSEVIAEIRALVASSSHAEAKSASPSVTAAGSEWQEVRFEGARDLGPALMGRPLGPSDIHACPELPEARVVFSELQQAFSSRLIGVAGAGKSVCALQAADKARALGMRVVRLRDPKTSEIQLTSNDIPTLHVIDDAHLADPVALVTAEQSADAARWLLTTHTATGGQESFHGAVRLDARGAVRIIAAALRSRRAETLRVVSRVDPRVSDRPFDESLDHRLDHAEEAANLPWQFCFILGGGWVRAGASASSAREAGADLVLAAAAIRQLASRDAPCAPGLLKTWCAAAGLDLTTFDGAVEWLVAQRLLMSGQDLRCPHQRFASVILGKILENQTPDGQRLIGRVLGEATTDQTMPLAGLSTLLVELRMAGHPLRWVRLLPPERHRPLIDRCAPAGDSGEVRGAAFLLAELQSWADDWPASIIEPHRETLVGWLAAPPEGAGYAIGALLGQISMKDDAEWRRLLEASDAAALAQLVSRSSHERAAECAGMAKWANATRSEDWKARFRSGVDRAACIKLMATWPDAISLWPASEMCQLFIYIDQEFGLDMVEALLPAIVARQRDRPQDTYQDLRDVLWHGLRLDDSLGIYTGAKGPTDRMKVIGRKMTSAWSPTKLGRQLSVTPKRDIQSAAHLLNFVRLADRRRFNATVAALDWEQINLMIGDDWGRGIHDIEVFLGVSHGAPGAAPKIAELIDRNSASLDKMSARFALMAPETARREVERGFEIVLSSEHFVEWGMGAGVVADFADNRPDLLDALLNPHIARIASELSRGQPGFLDEALPFLRVLQEAKRDAFDRMLSLIDPAGALEGWAKALKGQDEGRATLAWLIEHAIRSGFPIADTARVLRKRFPKASIPTASSLKRLNPVGIEPLGSGAQAAVE